MEGWVTEVRLFETRLVADDRRTLILSNADIYNGHIDNLTMAGMRRVQIDIFVAGGMSVVDTRAALIEALAPYAYLAKSENMVSPPASPKRTPSNLESPHATALSSAGAGPGTVSVTAAAAGGVADAVNAVTGAAAGAAAAVTGAAASVVTGAAASVFSASEGVFSASDGVFSASQGLGAPNTRNALPPYLAPLPTAQESGAVLPVPPVHPHAHTVGGGAEDAHGAAAQGKGGGNERTLKRDTSSGSFGVFQIPKSESLKDLIPLPRPARPQCVYVCVCRAQVSPWSSSTLLAARAVKHWAWPPVKHWA